MLDAALESTTLTAADGATLAVTRCGEGEPTVVLLHAGVADTRSWHGVMRALAQTGTIIAYDRRGFGESPAPTGSFRHLDDLIAVLDAHARGPVVLVGNSTGGALAIDAALELGDRIAGLVLVAPAVSGAPEEERLDEATEALVRRIDDADEAGDLDEVNRLEAWMWLDGPAREGRAHGEARELVLDMNAIALRNEQHDFDGTSGIDAWSRLEQVQVPVLVGWGEYEVPSFVARCREIVGRIPHAHGAELPDAAHLPSVEHPREVASLIRGELLELGGIGRS